MTERNLLSTSEEVIACIVGRGFFEPREVARQTGLRAQVVSRAMSNLATTGHLEKGEDGRYRLLYQFTPVDELILRSLASAESPLSGGELMLRCSAISIPRKAFFMSTYRLTTAGYVVEWDGDTEHPARKRYAATGKPPRYFEAVDAAVTSVKPCCFDPKYEKLRAIAEDRLRTITPILNSTTREALTVAKGLADSSRLSLTTIFLWLSKYDPLDPLGSLMPEGLQGRKHRSPGAGNEYSGRDNRPNISINSPASRRIVDALKKHGPMTIRQIAEAANVSLKTLQSQNYLADLCDAGLIHIADWERSSGGGRPSAIYEDGKGKNAPYPGPIPKSVLAANKRQRRQRAIREAKASAGVNALISAFSH